MGIRIHKVLGYGLIDIKTTGKYKETLADDRFNPNGYFAASIYDREETFTDVGFDSYLEANKEHPDDIMNDLYILRHLREQETLQPRGRPLCAGISNRIIYDTEGGLPNVMVFQPPVFGNDWSRYDDIIDYYDPQQSEDGGCATGYTLIDRAIYPFESFWDTRETPPKMLTGNDWHWYIDAKNSPRMVDSALKKLGFKTEEEMRRCIAPVVPKEVIALLKYCKVFTNDETITELRPMIYWYWS